MKAILVIALSLLVLIDGHRYRPYRRPNRFRRNSSICRSSNPCGSFYLYKERVVPAGSTCPTSVFTGGGFGRSASSEISNSNSASTRSESSEESVGSNESLGMESVDSLEVSNGSISNEEERRYGYGGGFNRLRRICVSNYFPIFLLFFRKRVAKLQNTTVVFSSKNFSCDKPRHCKTIVFFLKKKE